MPASTPTVTPSQLLRRLSTIFSTDLSEGADLLEVTYILVLRNLVKNFRQYGSKAYALLRIIVPYIVLVSGIYGTTLDLKAPSTAFKSIISWMTAPFTARIVVSANSPANKDVLAWLAVYGLNKDARTLELWDRPSGQVIYDQLGDVTSSEQDDFDQQSTPLRYIPDFGKYRFRFQGHFMSMERKDIEQVQVEGGPKPEGLEPTDQRRLVLECFPTLQGIKPLKRFLDHVNYSG